MFQNEYNCFIFLYMHKYSPIFSYYFLYPKIIDASLFVLTLYLIYFSCLVAVYFLIASLNSPHSCRNQSTVIMISDSILFLFIDCDALALYLGISSSLVPSIRFLNLRKSISCNGLVN